MARIIPPVIHPEVKSPGEKEVFTRFQKEAGTETWTVLHSLNLARHPKRIMGEIDFVVIVPGKGVVALEVKAVRSLSRDANGFWRVGTKPELDSRGPFGQVREEVFALTDYIRAQDPSLEHVPFLGVVQLPYIVFDQTSIEWERWELLDARAFGRPLAEQILGALTAYRQYLGQGDRAYWFKKQPNRPTEEDVARLTRVLRPEFERLAVVRANPQQRTLDLARATEEQLDKLDMLSSHARVILSGPAGSGKTVLAVEAARRAAGAGQRTLFLCYNRLLALWLTDVMRELNAGLTVTTLHAHLRAVAGDEAPPKNDASYWEVELPRRATERLYETGGQAHLYDMLIVDEAQDIVRPAYLEFLDLSLKGGLKDGQWRFFGDFEKQAIYTRGDLAQALHEYGVEVAPTWLVNNCRNTPRVSRIAATVGGLDPSYKRVLRGDNGFVPEVIAYEDRGDQCERLETLLDQLVDRGFAYEDIVLLSRLSEGSVIRDLSQRWRQRLVPLSAQPTLGRIRAGTIHAFKGLEAPVVIVTDVEAVDSEELRQLHYIALTRCLDHVVILARKKTAGQLRGMVSGPSG